MRDLLFRTLFPIFLVGKLNPKDRLADEVDAGSVAKWLRQRIANPSSSVRLRPEPLVRTPVSTGVLSFLALKAKLLTAALDFRGRALILRAWAVRRYLFCGGVTMNRVRP